MTKPSSIQFNSYHPIPTEQRVHLFIDNSISDVLLPELFSYVVLSLIPRGMWIFIIA